MISVKETILKGNAFFVRGTTIHLKKQVLLAPCSGSPRHTDRGQSNSYFEDTRRSKHMPDAGDGLLLSVLDRDHRTLRLSPWAANGSRSGSTMATPLKRSSPVIIGSGSPRFTSIPPTSALGRYRTGTSSMGPSTHRNWMRLTQVFHQAFLIITVNFNLGHFIA